MKIVRKDSKNENIHKNNSYYCNQEDRYMRKIILLIDCASEYDRRLLRGLVRYSREHGTWIFYRMPSHLINSMDGGRAVIQWAKKWKADAIVGRWRWDNTYLLSTLNIPIVLQNYVSRSTSFSNLTGDYIGTGILAARFFSNRRYKEFAYFGVKDVVWSEERLLGYREEIGRQGGNLHTMMVPDTYRSRNEVVAWLHSLPKPVAMFACDDEYALFLTEICKVENIPIPGQLALLGVDNDELLCQISDPQISSIELNVEQGGYKLGEMLDRQFEIGEKWSFNIIISPGEIVQRDSTREHNIKDPYVEKIVKFIDSNFDQYISTDQVFALVPLSRRSLEIRFKKEMDGMTVYKYLNTCRMHRFAQLLSTTDYSMLEIAEMCGTLNYANISRVFKRVFGCSPKEYRTMKKQEQNY